MEIRFHHVVLERVVVVSLVEKGIDASGVNFEIAMLQHSAGDCDGCFQFGTVVVHDQRVQVVVRQDCLKRSIKQVGLEINQNVILVLNQVLVGLKIQDEFRLSDNLVFLPL